MVKNVRWLYNKLGTVDISGIGNGTVSGALNTVQSGSDGKAASSHTHGVSDLPVSNSQVDSTSYVPSSAVVYSLKSMMDQMNSEINDMLVIVDPPNERYESKNLGTWSSVSDVDTFLSTYSHANNYSGLQLGNYVTINDGTYNVEWVIAGFDCEHNQTAADGTVYDNGYGICMIPKIEVTTGKWNTFSGTSGGYISSDMHTTLLPGIVSTLKNVLGDHIVTRNVLLSSSITNNKSSAYTWTTADATLMSIGQMNGKFASHNTKYDDGEANYKLPLFNYENYWIAGSSFWSRCISTGGAWCVNGVGSIGDGSTHYLYGIRPLIYLR